MVECRLATKVLAKHLGLFNWRDLSRLMDVQLGAGKTLLEMVEIVESLLHREAYTKDELASILDMCREDIESLILTPNTAHLETFKLHQRARHVYSEAKRVYEYQKICQTTQSLETLGRLMLESHKSCSEEYECSHPNLDKLVDLSIQQGAYGARLTGAGWGGCIVALVPANGVEAYVQYLEQHYYETSKLAKDLPISSYIFPTTPGPGANVFA